jgi:hypothetical protein
MVAMTVLSAVLAVQDRPAHHVRSDDQKVRMLFDAGMSKSTMFRSLVDALDRSDVIVYIVPKTIRESLGGYVYSTVTIAGPYRLLRVALDTRGAECRLVSLLAHELQHAVEVSEEPTARGGQDVEALFERLSIKFGCNSNCYETQAAIDVELVVREQLKAAR